MNLQSPKTTIPKSTSKVFDFLSNLKNFEKLMPENISKFELLEKDKFIFAISGMPEIVLEKKSEEAFNSIVLGSAAGKLDFTLETVITELSQQHSQVHLNFSGNFNPMMAMMIKGPITKFIETLATKIPDAL